MQPRRPFVWVVNNSLQHDFSAAAEYGEVRSVTEGRINVFGPVDRLQERIAEALVEFDSFDYLLLSGHALVNTMAILEVLKQFGFVNLLIYGARRADYRHIVLNEPSLKGLKEQDKEVITERAVGYE